MHHFSDRPTGLPRRRLAALAAASALLLAGCSGEPAAAPAEPEDSGTTILQPGRPGEPAGTIAAEDVPGAAQWNHTDAAFAQMMIPHHAQALEMSRLAATRAHSPAVKALARRIRGAQGPEIIALAAWLDQRGLKVPAAAEDHSAYDHGAHGHTPMAGMLTEEQMDALRSARGRRFDRLFLEGMIRHHRGAVEMAESVGRDGSDVVIGEMAADVAATQSAEITRMRELLARL